MNRREFLTTAGTVAGAVTAGCLGTGDSIQTSRVNASATNGQRVLTNGERADFDGRQVRLTVRELQRSIIVTTDDPTVLEPPVGQFLVADIEASAIDLGPIDSAFRLTIDDRVPEPIGDGIQVLSDREERLAFWIPATAAASAQIELLVGYRPAWRVPEPLVGQFESAPSFHVLDAGIRESDGQRVLDMSIENRGEQGGIFRALTLSGERDKFEQVLFTINADETLSVSIRNDIVSDWPATAGFNDEITPETRVFAPASE